MNDQSMMIEERRRAARCLRALSYLNIFAQKLPSPLLAAYRIS